MTHDTLWDVHYEEVMLFMARNLRRPSRHRLEERHMVNWIKYNKKLIARGALSEERLVRFRLLTDQAAALRRLNQYAYKNTQELSLF